jgi:hypothetical protein
MQSERPSVRAERPLQLTGIQDSQMQLHETALRASRAFRRLPYNVLHCMHPQHHVQTTRGCITLAADVSQHTSKDRFNTDTAI